MAIVLYAYATVFSVGLCMSLNTVFTEGRTLSRAFHYNWYSIEISADTTVTSRYKEYIC